MAWGREKHCIWFGEEKILLPLPGIENRTAQQLYQLSYREQSLPLKCAGKSTFCMLQCAHVVRADTPSVSRPARVRLVQGGNRRCDKEPSISCHVASKRRSTERPSSGPDQTVAQCYCHCREQLTGTQGRLLQVCSCNTDTGSTSGAAHFRNFVRAMFISILFKDLLFETRQLHRLFKYLCSLHYTTPSHTHTHTHTHTHNTYSYVGQRYYLPNLTPCPECPSLNDCSYLYQHFFSSLRPVVTIYTAQWSLYVPSV